MTVFTTKTKQGLVFSVKVGQRKVRVRFTVSTLFGNVGLAQFYTSDVELIEAMKKLPFYNERFFIECEQVDNANNPTNEEQGSKEIDYRSLCKDSENIVEELSVVDVATAQNWCQRTHGTVFKARKAETIKTEAAEKYNALFPNLN